MFEQLTSINEKLKFLNERVQNNFKQYEDEIAKHSQSS